MIGGTVIETVITPERVWINCREKEYGDECAIYVENDAKARTVAEGDSVWWQQDQAMWTPKGFHPNGRSGIDFDIRLKKLGYSGPHPRPASGYVTGTEAEVCADIAARQQRGIAKYGVTVQDNPLPLKEWLQHAYEETLDKAIYLKRAIAECSHTDPIQTTKPAPDGSK